MTQAKKSIVVLFLALIGVSSFVGCAWFPRNVACNHEFSVDFKVALQYAQMAQLAYSPEATIMDSCGTDKCFYIEGEHTEARAFVRINDSGHIQWVAFRGTAELSDVKLDADYTRHVDSVLKMTLHMGFASASRELYPLILQYLKTGYKTRVTGHSLGGAVAAVSSLYFRKAGFDVTCFTFGQPKVTNVPGADRADSLDIIRFVNVNDIVTSVPPVDYRPGQDLGAYQHFGKEIELMDGNKFQCIQAPFINQFDAEYWWNHMQEQSVKDHSMINYLNKIAALAH